MLITMCSNSVATTAITLYFEQVQHKKADAVLKNFITCVKLSLLYFY